MLILKIFFACVKRWWHCLTHMFFTKPTTHRECSLTTKTDDIFYLKIYCECGKVFGEWKIDKEGEK